MTGIFDKSERRQILNTQPINQWNSDYQDC
jgi:hypothetical protein